MTAACGGGPSQIKPLIEEIQVLTAGVVVSSIIAAKFEWYAAAAAGIGYLTFDFLNICASDPPGYPTITAERFGGYFDPRNPQGALWLREDATQILQTYFWYQYCECVTGPQPTLPQPTPQPTGVAVNTPPGPPAPGAGSCAPGPAWGETNSFDASGNRTYDLAQNSWTSQNNQYCWIYSNTGAGSDALYPIDWSIIWKDAYHGNVLGSFQWTQQQRTATLGGFAVQTTVPAGALQAVFTAHSATGANQSTQTAVETYFYCTAPPLGTQQPCCPPDPTLENMLVQIQQTLVQVLSELNQPKQAFADSTVHSGLSGTGSVSISPAAIGIRIDITARTDPWPDNPGTPNFLFSIGFITPFAVGTPLRGSRLVYDHQIFTYPSYTDQIGYTLPQGVVINLVELVPAVTSAPAF